MKRKSPCTCGHLRSQHMYKYYMYKYYGKQLRECSPCKACGVKKRVRLGTAVIRYYRCDRYQGMDNLTMVERLAQQKGLV